MLSLRKAAVIAAFLLGFIYFLQSTRSSSAPPRTAASPPARRPETPKQDVEGTAPRTTAISDSSVTRPYPPPRQNIAGKQNAQKPLTEKPPPTLREKLEAQYDYDKQSKFPAYIWQTWRYTPGDGRFDDNFRPAEASWTEKHPGFVHEVVTDAPAVLLMRHLYASVPDVIEAYEALPLPVLKADFFRYLILLARGGIYTDIDTTALQSTTDWLPEDLPRSSIGLVVGIEADPDRDDWKDWYSRRIQFCQWTIQAKPGHPVLVDIVATITEDTLQMKRKGLLNRSKLPKSIVEFTGPAVWTDAIFNYLNNPTYFNMADGRNVSWESFTGIESAKKIGDVVILPITSFSPGVQQMGAKEPDDPMAFVKHEFEGTWKPPSERIHPEREAQIEEEKDGAS